MMFRIQVKVNYSKTSHGEVAPLVLPLKLDGKYDVDDEGLLCLPANLEGSLELEVRLEVDAIIFGGEHALILLQQMFRAT